MFLWRDRLMQFDFGSLLFNLAMFFLEPLITQLGKQGLPDDALTQVIVILFCFAIVSSQPIGGILILYSAHPSNPHLPRVKIDVQNIGCLLIPIYYMAQLMFLGLGSILIAELLGLSLTPALGVIIILGLLIIAAINTWVVHRYFTTFTLTWMPTFLKGWQLKPLADLLMFFNLLGYQMLWWFLLADPYFSTPPGTVSAMVEKVFALVAMLLFFYIPPRVFYFAEKLNPMQFIIGMFVSNVPIFLHAFLGDR